MAMEQTKEVVAAVATGAELYDAYRQSGWSGLATKAPEFVVALFKALEGISLVPKELEAASQDDSLRQAVVQEFAAQLDLADDRIEDYAERLFAALTQVADGVYEIQQIVVEYQKPK